MTGALRGLFRRTTWAFADQGLSSLSNFGLLITVAHFSSSGDFGLFSLVFALYLMVAGIGQSIASTPLTIYFAAATKSVFRQAARKATGTALLVGILSGLLLEVFALGAPPGLRLKLLVAGLLLPGALLQDCWRYAFITGKQPERAAVNDGLWLALQILGFAGLVAIGQHDSVEFLAAWGLAGTGAATFGCLQLRLLPKPSDSFGWLRQHGSLVARFALESVIVRGSFQLAVVIVGAISGLSALGSLRGAQVLFSPLNLVFLGAVFAAVPEGVRVLQAERSDLLRFVRFISGLALTGTVVWAVVLIVDPARFTARALGSIWSTAAALMVVVAAQNFATAASIGPQVGLRALGDADSSLRSHSVHAVLIIIGTAAGAHFGGAQGAGLGIALGTLGGTAAWWYLFLASARRPARQVAGG